LWWLWLLAGSRRSAVQN